MVEESLTLEPIERLSRDLRSAARILSEREARWLVDTYYTLQNYRIRSQNQVRSTVETEEPNDLIMWSFSTFERIEKNLRGAMQVYAQSSEVGEWSLSICGIGPVIAAGLLAHIDIHRVQNVSQVWSFAGLDPSKEWKKNTKRPWNAKLKTLCWKIGESFVKVSGRDSDYYGKVYLEKKELEIARNESGELADQAAAKLEKFRIGKDTDAYKCYNQGKLPPAHIHARAKRYAVKLFLAHWFHVAWVTEKGEEPAPPRPYIIDIGGHSKLIPVPNF